MECQIDFYEQRTENIRFSAKGFADVVKNGIVYELKFVLELTHEHFLQCASYMVAMNLQKGILWNTRDNTSYEIEVPDRKAFLDAVTRTVTKGMIESYSEPDLSKKNAEGDIALISARENPVKEQQKKEVHITLNTAGDSVKKKGILVKLFGRR